jgi:signal transduction histidine kinase
MNKIGAKEHGPGTTMDTLDVQAGQSTDEDLVARAELEQALQYMLSTTVEICGADSGLLSILDPKSQAVRWRISVGMEADGFESLEQISFRYASAEREANPATSLERVLGLRSVHSTPVYSRSKERLGVLSVHFKKKLSIAQLEAGMAALSARYVADALEAAQCQQDLRETNRRLQQNVDDSATQLRALALELTRTEQRERKRLAQELHDNIQQLLVAVKMRVSRAFSRNLGVDAQDVIALTDEAISSCRALVVGLSPPFEHGVGLPEILNWLAVHMRNQHGLEVDLKIKDAPQIQSEILRFLLFEVSRELLFNVVKHGKTCKAELSVGRKDGHVFLEVSDQGAGCDPHVLEKTCATSFGLYSIRERLTALGGRLETSAKPGHGCRIRVHLPSNVE